MFGTALARNRVKPVLQTANTDCAPACLAMVANHFSVPVTLPQVREELDPGRDGASVVDIRTTARAHGLQARAIRVDAQAVADGTLPLPTPFIAHCTDNHFVVVERVRRGHVHLLDPAVGRRRMSAASYVEESTGVVLLFQPDGAAPARPPAVPLPSAGRQVLWPLVLRHRGRLAVTVAVSGLLMLLGLAVPAATALITNTLAAGRSTPTSWMLFVVLLAAVCGGLALIRGLMAATLQRNLSQDLSLRVAEQLFARSYRYFERRSTGDLFMRVASADMIRELLGVALIGALLDTLLTTGYLIALLALDPLLAAVATGLLAVELTLAVVLAGRSATLRREELLAAADADSLMVDAISGIASIRTCAAEQSVLSRWATFVGRRLDAATRRSRVAGVSEAISTTSRFAAPLLFLLIAGLSAGSPGAAIGLAGLAAAVLAPLTSLSARLVSAADLKPMLERIVDVDSAAAEPQELEVPGRLSGQIELSGLGFRYDARSPFVFRGLDVTIPAGSKVAVVGSSGCGKSTLVSLLTGLHDPTEGCIRFDGQDLATLDKTSVRRQISVVLQEPYLGLGTIRDAITFGRTEFTDEDVVRAAMKAGIAEEIAAMPLGLATRVAEGGRGVSGGQRQRIALARALLGSPAVLILDEATSSLDGATEARIEQQLRDLTMTRVVIAHRLSTVADADLVLVMHDGRLAEIGAPGELSARGGLFAAMLDRAAGEGRRALPRVVDADPDQPEPARVARAGSGASSVGAQPRRTGRHRRLELADSPA